MAKSIHAANDFSRFLDLESETKEAQGRMTFPIVGHIQFDNVIFSYPSQPNVPVLKGMTFEVKPGECVGIVGWAFLPSFLYYDPNPNKSHE